MLLTDPYDYWDMLEFLSDFYGEEGGVVDEEIDECEEDCFWNPTEE